MFSVALEKKWIIYSKNEPGLRAVILLGDADKSGNADQSSHTDHWQPVVKIGLETSGGLDWDAYVRQGKKLFAEFCRIRRPGRPVGTGRPLKPADEGAEAHEFDLRHFYDKLDAAGFTEMERETLMTYFQVGSQVRASKILKITPPALFKRLNRLDAKFKKAFGEHIPRRFSNRHITDTGERRNRKRTFDGSKNYFTPKEPPDPFEDIRFKNEPAE
jgi:hypothetical protein